LVQVDRPWATFQTFLHIIQSLVKIYGPTLDNDGTWRIKTNEELEMLIKKKIIVRFIKSQNYVGQRM